MSETRVIGTAGDVIVRLETDCTQVHLRQDGDLIVLTLTDAVYLAVLLDEAIAVAKGEAAKLDKGSD